MLLVALALADTGEVPNMITAPASCTEGDVIDVAVGSACPAGSTVAWTDDSAETDYASTTATDTTWTCPSVECSTAKFHLYVICEDSEGHQWWGSAPVEVACEEEGAKESTGLCSTTGVGAASMLGLALSLVAMRRTSRAQR